MSRKNASRKSAPLHPLGNPLFAHDVAIARAVLKDIFSQWQDLVTVAIALAFGGLLIHSSVASLNSQKRELLMLAVSVGGALMLDMEVRRRLQLFRAESPLAVAALSKPHRLAYRLALHLIASIALMMVLFLPYWTLSGRFLGVWWLTLLLIQLFAYAAVVKQAPAMQVHFAFWSALWRSRTVGAGAKIVAPIAAFIIFCIAQLGSSAAIPFAAAGLSACVLAWYSPVDHGIVNFERICGYPPLRSLRVRLGDTAAIGLLLVAAAGVSHNPAVAFGTGAACVGVLAYRALAVVLSRLVPPRQVQFAMAGVLFVGLALALTAVFIAPVLLIALTVWLLRKAGKKTWLLQ